MAHLRTTSTNLLESPTREVRRPLLSRGWVHTGSWVSLADRVDLHRRSILRICASEQVDSTGSEKPSARGAPDSFNNNSVSSAGRRFQTCQARRYMSFASLHEPRGCVQEERCALLPKVLLRPPGHQFQSPRMRMVAGTRRIRMIVASTKTATASPSPMALVRMIPVKAKAPVTTMMIAAADVMMPAVVTRPFETLAVLESPFS